MFNIVDCAVGIECSMLWIVVFGFACSMLWFVLLDLDVSCGVLFPTSREVINKPLGDCTPLYSCQTPFVGTSCTNSCLFVNNSSSCRGPLNKTSTISIQVGGLFVDLCYKGESFLKG